MKTFLVVLLFGIAAVASVNIQSEMTESFQKDKTGKGEKIITHPSGIKSTYDLQHLQEFRAQLVRQRNELDASIAKIDKDIAEIQKVEK